MFGIKELKHTIKVLDNTIECPVKECNIEVERQKDSFKKEGRYKCQKHNIFISPSTFEYESGNDNLLWKAPDDLILLDKIKKVKRESRMARDNSEDALTWNVFRYLEKSNNLNLVLEKMSGKPVSSSEIIYWSFSQNEPNKGSSWSMLNNARIEFGESIERGSEPDIIVVSDKALFFIEAKFTSGNKTEPSNDRVKEGYLNGGEGWFSKVFKSDFQAVAVESKKYELMRFWLIGTWIAEKLDMDFYLVNLVLSKKEKDIEKEFKKHINETDRSMFRRFTWEDIYYEVVNGNRDSNQCTMIDYFKNKAIGYDGSRNLQKAFSIKDN